MKNIVSEMKNTLEGRDIRLVEAEGQSAIWKTRLQKTPNQSNKNKKYFLKMKIV